MIVFVHILINIWRDLDSFIRFTIIFIGQHMIFVKCSIRQFIFYSISYHERFYTNQFRACYDIEKLCHLEQLPFTGFQFIGLPIKIDKASAGWIRAIAIVPD